MINNRKIFLGLENLNQYTYKIMIEYKKPKIKLKFLINRNIK